MATRLEIPEGKVLEDEDGAFNLGALRPPRLEHLSEGCHNTH
eukprot:SAG11_NODE_15758_length_567_cov_1.000000_1_plen_42_part_00